MSCNYADGLSPYDNKGVLGVPERFDNIEKVCEKSALLAEWIQNAKHVVVHTGAGISTTAGIPDFRGPNGVWTLEKEGKKPNINISFNDAIPTKTHMALKNLIEKNLVHFIISQNIDGLHLRSGLPRKYLAELHGNMFVEECNACNSQFVRSLATTSVGKKCLEQDCKRSDQVRSRTCRGKLYDTILDWEHSLPDDDLELSDYNSSLADLNICIGTTLQIVPSGNLPLRCKKYGGKVVIINLQPTKHDKKADLIINYYADDVMEKVMKKLGLEIPEFSIEMDPTKNQMPGQIVSWNFLKSDIKATKSQYEKLCKDYKKRKSETDAFKLKKKNKKEIKEVKNEIIKNEDLMVKCELKNEENEKFSSVDLTLSSSDEGDIFVENFN